MRINEVTSFDIEGNVGILITNSPPVNAISAPVRQGLADGIVQALAAPDVQAIVILCEGRTFYAGADITEFDKPVVEPSLHALQRIIEGSSKPVVAAIHGNALGGGLELALVAHFRIADPSAKLGLPEVNLGLLPGAGGTQRLPRLVGIAKALEMITSGRPVSAAEALSIGLVDELAEGDLRENAVAFTNRLIAQAQPLLKLRDRADKLGDATESARVIERFRAESAVRFGRFHAPEAIIKCVEATLSNRSFEEGLDYETDLFCQLLADPQSAAMRHVFFAERQAVKVEGVPAGYRPASISNVAVVSGGTASRLGQAFEACGVTLSDVSQADLVILPTTDNAEIVSQALRQVVSGARPDAILALDGSFDLQSLAPSFGQLDRLVAIHLSPQQTDAALLEVIVQPETAPSVIAAVMKLAKSAGLVGVVAQGNSIAERLCQVATEQCDLLKQEGVPVAEVNAALATLGLLKGHADIELLQSGVVERIVQAVAGEGASLLQSNIASRSSDIDIISVFGLGWRKYLGGPMFQSGRQG